MGRNTAIMAAIIVGAVAWALWGLDISAGRTVSPQLFVRELFPPRFQPWGPIGHAMVETVQIAILATVMGVILSVPVGLLAARTVFPSWIATPVRMVATAVRVLPAILWAIFAIVIVGQGPLAGTIALTFYTIGYLAKLQAEAIEGIPRDAVEAVRAMGAPRYQQAWHVVLPEAANALRSQALFMFEYNVRNSSVLGIVGAGGMGVDIAVLLQFGGYDRIMAYLVALFALVVLIDGLSYLVRKRYIELDAPRARWRDVLWPRRDPPPS